jgi:hypothetical protein
MWTTPCLFSKSLNLKLSIGFSGLKLAARYLELISI